MTTRTMLGDGDADEIVRSVERWAAGIGMQSKWTIDPSEAA